MNAVPEVFHRATSSMVSDALDELDVAGVLFGLEARHQQAGTTVGRALPVGFQAKSRDERAYRFGGGVGRPLEAALKAMRAGHFLLFDLQGSERAACWGGLASRLALRTGVAGVGIWGSCRDVDEIRTLGFPVWSSSVCPRRSRNDFSFGSIGEPIEIRGVSARPGDLVVADATGVVVVPDDQVAAVAELVERVFRQERALESQLEQGATVDWDAI